MTMTVNVDPSSNDFGAVMSIETGAQTHVIRITKEAGRVLETERAERKDAKLRAQIEPIIEGTRTAGRLQNGWDIRLLTEDGFSRDGGWYAREYVPPSGALAGFYRYHVDILAVYEPKRKRADVALEVDLQNIVNGIAVKGNFPKWKVTLVDGQEWKARAVEDIEAEAGSDVASEIGYAPLVLPDVCTLDHEHKAPDCKGWQSYFSHLNGLQDHIERVRRSIVAAIESNWQHRFHCMLAGPPGCGKTDILQSLKLAVGEESVLEFDGTATTLAGAQQELLSREDLPRLLIVEEIEKAPEGTLPWLLGLMDTRAEIRKTTVKGQALTSTRMLCLFTVNDVDAFKRIASGALASRTANKVIFSRPSRDTRWKILLREVKRVHGDTAWIDPAIDFAELMESNDPRELIAMCMMGRDALVTGDYQEMVMRTMDEETLAKVNTNLAKGG